VGGRGLVESGVGLVREDFLSGGECVNTKLLKSRLE
jgi:hypothetical protein